MTAFVTLHPNDAVRQAPSGLVAFGDELEILRKRYALIFTEDVLSEAVLGCLYAYMRFGRAPEAPTQYFLRVAHNARVDEFRKSTRRVQLFCELDGPTDFDPPASEQEDCDRDVCAQRVEEVLANLGHEDRLRVQNLLLERLSRLAHESGRSVRTIGRDRAALHEALRAIGRSPSDETPLRALIARLKELRPAREP